MHVRRAHRGLPEPLLHPQNQIGVDSSLHLPHAPLMLHLFVIHIKAKTHGTEEAEAVERGLEETPNVFINFS